MNFFFLSLALLATICFMGISISIAEESMIGFLSSLLLLIGIMGIGFAKKKKAQEKETV